MDGENNGKPVIKMDDFGGFGGIHIFGNTHMCVCVYKCKYIYR